MNLEEQAIRGSQNRRGEKLSATMVAAGLRAAAFEVTRGADRQGLLNLADAMQRSSSTDADALAIPNLPPGLKQIVLTGIEMGRLPRLLEEYLAARRQSHQIWRSFYGSLFYPFLMMGIAGLIVVGFLVFGVPQFKSIFMDFGVELPFITEFLIHISDFIITSGLWIAGFLLTVVVVIAILSAGRILPFARFRAQVFQVLPWVGKSQQMAASAEFCSRLAVLVECRIPLHEALAIVSKSIRDPLLCHAALVMSNRVENGTSPERASRGIPGVSYELASVFRWAHNPEVFADGLRSLAIVFAAQARLSTSQLVLLAEPFSVVGVGLMVGFIVIALFMPLIKLLNELS